MEAAALVTVCLLFWSGSPPRPDPAEPGPRIPLVVRVQGLSVPYRVMGLFVMPGDSMDFDPLSADKSDPYRLEAERGSSEALPDGSWRWTAPVEPGFYEVRLLGQRDTVTFNVVVKTLFRNGQTVLNGYHIGEYPASPLRGDPQFKPPLGLIELNEITTAVKVSPSFRLGDFASHQAGSPKYIALDERLVLKLESVLDSLRARGMRASTFTVMSGYRTPWYNASIGNTTRYSLHLFGRAADIFVDEDADGRMDDLDGNGRVNREDARFLFRFIDDQQTRASFGPYLGGLGLYDATSSHGPYVHVDVRGHVVHW